MEPLTILLAGAIGKAVFKSWFKDNEFVASAGESLVEIIEKVVPERRAKSAAIRQMERVSEKAADALEPYLGFEHIGLDKSEVDNAAKEVANAIESININSSLLAEIDFNASKLTEKICNAVDVARLSRAEQDFATTLTVESADLIVDLSSALPEFHRDTYTEILKRESEIIDKIDKVFTEVQNIRRFSDYTGEGAAARFEETYRKSVARNLDQIELFGLDAVSRPSTRQHNLSTAYISLTVSGLPAENVDESEVSSNYAIRAENAAAISPLVVIKGEAGSGKTTLLQSLAVRAATASFDGDLEPWNDRIPFFIRLRALADGVLPPPEQFPALVAPIIAATMPAQWVHEQLSAGRGLILIDGLDEISSTRRDAARSWVSDLIGSYPHCRVAITTRPPAVPDGWLSAQGFVELELLPMSPEDVEKFIDHWHRAVSAEEQDEEKRTELGELGEPLKNRIRGDRALQELASTPLLCAMLCAMNRDRKEVLPTNKIALYEAAVHMIIHARDEQRRIELSDLPDLDFETKLTLLQEIALWMMQNGWSMVDRWRLDDLIHSKIPTLTRIDQGVAAGHIADALILRSGVLRSPVDGKVDFIHNAFKEYLTAKGVIAGDHFGFLEGQLRNEAWREVAVLAVAMADGVRRSQFIERLLELGDSSEKMRSTFHLLALRCLETCTQLDANLQNEIRQRLSGLHAPVNFTEATALAAAGDLAIPLVAERRHQLARTAAACIRTLRLINSPQALEALEYYAVDKRYTVMRELMACWTYFDPAEFSRKVLSKSRGIAGAVDINHPKFLEGIEYLTKIDRLSISLGRYELPDRNLAKVRYLKNLRTLMVQGKGRFDVRWGDGLTRLSRLHLNCSRLDGLEEATNLPALSMMDLHAQSAVHVAPSSVPPSTRSLTIRSPELEFSPDAFKGKDIFSLDVSTDNNNSLSQAISELNNLRSLGVATSDPSKILTHIRNPLALSSLSLRQLSSVSDLSFFGGYEHLESVFIGGASDLLNIEFLANLKNLKRLSIHGAYQVSNIAVLLELPKLEYISLDVGEDAELGPLRSLGVADLALSRSNFVRARDLGLKVAPKYFYTPHMVR